MVDEFQSRSKAGLLEWRKTASERVLDALPMAAKHFFGISDHVGVPFVPGAKNAREEAIVLLQVGAEVEHALLLQYLFAAYSIDPSAGAGPATWQATLVTIARQEMAHLIVVQNLLRALSSPVHFDREDFPLHPSLYPFPVALEAVSKESLAKYVAAEMPPLDTIVDAAVKAEVEEILKVAKVATHQDVQRVGMIYAHAYWLFRKADAPDASEPWQDLPAASDFSPWHILDSDFASAADTAGGSTAADWGLAPLNAQGMHIDAVTDRQSALQAIYTIAAQGEGPATQADSHFQKFLNLYREFHAFPGTAVFPVVTNPSTTQEAAAGGAPEVRSPITEPTSRLWAQFLDVRYEIVLMTLILGVQEPVAGASGARQTLLDWAVVDMRSYLGVVGQVLAAAPLEAAAPAGSAKNAGAPFELLHGPLPADTLNQWVRLKKLLAKSAALVLALGTNASDVFGAPPVDDAARMGLVDARIKAVLDAPLPG